MRYLSDKRNKIPTPCQTVATARIDAQNLPGPDPNIWLTLFQISSNLFNFGRVIAKRVQANFLRHRVFSLEALGAYNDKHLQRSRVICRSSTHDKLSNLQVYCTEFTGSLVVLFHPHTTPTIGLQLTLGTLRGKLHQYDVL